MEPLTVTTTALKEMGPTIDVLFTIPLKLEEIKKTKKEAIPSAIRVKALIDTGASDCAITLDIPKTLGLNYHDEKDTIAPNGTKTKCYVYFMRMIIPSSNYSYEGDFTALSLDGQGINCLIGRDMLSKGVFIYNGSSNQFTLALN